MKLLYCIIDGVTEYLDSHTKRMFDVEQGKLQDVPNPVIWLVYIMSVNVLLQGVVDIIIKIGGYTPWIVKFPWRMDFLFLTAISVLMGYQTLIGMRRRELDVTRNSVQIGLLVEVALLVGDAWFIIQNRVILPEALPIRMPFMIFTLLNIIILSYLVFRLHLFKDEQGNWRFF